MRFELALLVAFLSVLIAHAAPTSNVLLVHLKRSESVQGRAPAVPIAADEGVGDVDQPQLAPRAGSFGDAKAINTTEEGSSELVSSSQAVPSETDGKQGKVESSEQGLMWGLAAY